MPDDIGRPRFGLRQQSIESRASWITAWVTLAILSLVYGSTLVIVVGLKAIETDLGVPRSVMALAGAVTWIGTGSGGIAMGWLADRIGIRANVVIGAVMVAAGLALCATGQVWALYIGQGVFIGFFGMGAIYPPPLTYVSRWFDRRRGTALALISSGQYVAGVAWPALFERLIAGPGWRFVYLAFAGLVLVSVVPVALLWLKPAPAPLHGTAEITFGRARPCQVLGLPPNLVQAILCPAGFCCCIPMSIPQAHLVAFCGDIGIGAATGAVMLSLLLGYALEALGFCPR